jgi:type IV pilus assembly protein PilQ
VLFRNKSRSNTKREMLVFITPKMIAEKAIGR